MASRLPAGETYAPRITHFDAPSLDDLFEEPTPPNALWLAGDLDRVMAAADDMLASDPADVTGYWLRIRVLLARQQLDEALATFAAALERWPHNNRLRGRYAYALLAAGRPDDAVAIAEQLNHDNATSAARAMRGTVLAKAGQVDRALELEPIANPPQPRVHLRRAALLLEARRFDRAVDETDRALDAGANSKLANAVLAILYLRRAEALLYLGRIDEAELVLDEAELIADPESVGRLRMQCAFERGDVTSALGYVDGQLTRMPTDCFWPLLRAHLEVERGDAAAARPFIARAAVALTNEFRQAHAPHAPSGFRRISIAIGSLCAVLDWHAGDLASADAHAHGCLETFPPLVHARGQQWDLAVERSLAHLIVGNRRAALEELQDARSDQLPLREPPGRFDLLALAPQGPPPGLTMVRGVVIDA